MRMNSPPENCPNCGADVPANAKACPACGADEKTGWSEEAYVGGLNLPDESFDYDEFVRAGIWEEEGLAARHQLVLVGGGDRARGIIRGSDNRFGWTPMMDINSQCYEY